MVMRKLFNVVLLVGVLLIAGCIDGVNPRQRGGNPIPWKPDGRIEPGEYSYNFSSGDFSTFFRVENGTLFVGIMAQTHGWLAVGFGGGPGMKDTDIVIAYVLPNRTVRIRDDYSTGFAGPHNPDTSYGGEEDILSYGGSEKGDFTIVEFSRKLDTGDPYDFTVPLNRSFRVIWAYGIVDDFLSDHTNAGQFYVALGGGLG